MKIGNFLLADLAHTSFGYRFFLLLHLLTAIVGFGSSFVWPMLSSKARRLDPVQGYELNRAGAAISRPLTVYMMFGVLITGLALSGAGAGWKFSQVWVWLAFVLTTAIAVIATFFQTPNADSLVELQGKIASGDQTTDLGAVEKCRKRDAMFGGINHTLFLVVMILMIWKPGS